MTTLLDLNDYLFSQLDRLDSSDDDNLDAEINRTRAICDVSKQIIDNANTIVNAAKIQSDFMNANTKLPKLIGVNADE